jgi:hypothetical protein
MNRSLRTKLFFLTLTFFLAFGLTTPVVAQGLVTGDTIPAGMTLNQDVILVGQDVAIDGTVNGNAFILGNQVTINGKVDGSIILIGQNASIGGQVSGTVYALALTLDLPAPSLLGRDLYAGTVSLTSQVGSSIARHLYAIGLDAGLNGQVGGDLHTAIGPIQLYNGLMTLLGFNDLTIHLHFEIPQPAPTPGSSLLSAGRYARLHLASGPAPKTFDWGKWGIDLLRNWAILSVLGLLAFWLIHKPLDRSGETLRQRPWRTLGIGLLVLVILVALIVVGLLLAVLVFSLGLALSALGLWQLSIILWIAFYACLALALAALLFFVIYGTKIIVIYVSATWLFGVLFRRKTIWMDVLALLAGAAVYSLLRTLPYAGWVVGVLITAAGAGSGWLAFRQHTKVLVIESETVIEEQSPQVFPTKKSTQKAEKRPGKAQSATVRKST